MSRDRLITPKRGAILDRNGEGIALTETVNAVSVIPVQVKEKEKTAQFLAEMLDSGKRGFRRNGQQGIYPRIPYRRQDGNLGKAAAQKRKIYCILSILCAMTGIFL